MPSLASFQSNKPVKILYVGDPGSGKTGSLVSLVKAGYKLRIWDFDNLLEPLFQFVMRECPDKAGNVAFQTFTDPVATPAVPTMMIGQQLRVQSFVKGTPTAFINALKQMDAWKTPEEDLGNPADWGTGTFAVLDTLSMLSNSAFNYVQAMNPGARESQTYYGAAQQLIINMLAKLFSEQFHTNVIVLAHIDYSENHLGVQKGFPKSKGKALHSDIGSYFNCILQATNKGSEKVILTKSTGIVDLKNPVPFSVPDSLPLGTGLADFMRAIRQPQESK
jgi:hypothetical protein